MQTSELESINCSRTELHAAFLAFGSVSEQLSEAFDSLRAEVARLRAQLDEAQAGNEHLAARLAALLDALPGGVLVLDEAGAIQQNNPAALQLLGGPLLGMSFATALARAAADSNRVHEHVELRTGRFVNIARRDLGGGGEVVLLA